MKFATIKEALAFQTECIFCKSRLVIDSKHTSSYNNRFRFVLSSSSQEAILVDKETENVIIVHDAKITPSKRKQLNFQGQFWTSMNIDCEECGKFSYVLSLKFDIEEKKLFDIEMNVVSVTFDENDLISEVRNLYSFNETQFITYDSSGDTRVSKLPLISINLANPNETLNRIRKLVIFS